MSLRRRETVVVEPTPESSSFDTPDNEDVLQPDEEPMVSVPVTIEGVARVDEMPSSYGSARNILLTPTGRAEQIVGQDARRKKVILWTCVNLDVEMTNVMVAMSEAEANDFHGVILQSGAQAVSRYEFTYAGELWARSCLITDTAGNDSSIGAATDDIYLSIFVEQWAR